MGNCLKALLLLILAFCAASASAQPLVNIDCGTSVDTVGFAGLNWVGDKQYVQSGQSAEVQIDDNLMAPLKNLRYFPSRKKNCYAFPGIGIGNKILVRAWFYYGNYDRLSSPPTFDLLFNGNCWVTVITNVSQMHEVIYITKAADVSICLVRTNLSDVPFINSLEIKKLNQSMYNGMDTNRPLYLRGRFAYASDVRVRYPDDKYDRIWSSFTYYEKFGLSPLTGSSDPTIDLANAPPAAVLRQGVTTFSSQSSDLTIPIPISMLSISPVPHYVTFYFVELLPNATRSFYVYITSDNQTFESVTIVPNGKVRDIRCTRILLSTRSELSLVRESGSPLPPLISAAEFYEIGGAWDVAITDISDVKALRELQQSYVQLQAWSGDPCLPIGYVWEWINCSSDSTPRVTALYLSGYELTGPLVDFSKLTALQTIDLHNNSLSGSVPEFLGGLPKLKELNLADNQFNGSLPASITGNSMINLNISGNNISNSNDTTNSTETKTNVGIMVGATIGSILFLLLLVMISIFLFKKRNGNAVRWNPSGDKAKQTSTLLEPNVNQGFSYAEIVEITKNFEKVIGKGGSGNVYYGQLQDGHEVAVKVLKNLLSQGTKEFVAEVKLLMTVHHRCLVSFVGYCEEGGNLVLLYEYMSGGNLRQLLSGRSSSSAFLTWQIRLQIALRVATGLDYLHSGCYPPIIHRDVKTTNILLDAKMEAKVADFGLSKSGQKDDVTQPSTTVSIMRRHFDREHVFSSYSQNDDVTQLSTVVAGTPGYIDPEYSGSNMVTKKSDVYSFGVVLLELITGRPPIFAESGERLHIVKWVTPKLVRRDIHSVADPTLRGQYNVNSMWKVADIAMSCTSETSNMRPHMVDVVIQLKEALGEEFYYQQRIDTPSVETQDSPTSYDFCSSSLSSSHLPPP